MSETTKVTEVQDLGEEKEKENETPKPAEGKEETMKKEKPWKKVFKWVGIVFGALAALGGAFLLGSGSQKKKKYSEVSRPAEIPDQTYSEPDSDSGVPYADESDFTEVE